MQFRLRCPIVEHLLRGVPSLDAARLRTLDCMATATSVRPLDGGITNRNYRVQTPEGDKVVRISDQESSLLAIDRENEYLNSLAAAQAGVGAPVSQYVRGAGMLVVDWIAGTTLTADDLTEPTTLIRVAEVCHRLHRGPRFASNFNMFQVQAGYRNIVRQRGFRLPDRYDEFQGHLERIKKAMAVNAEDLVPCNNDLLPANIIDDGWRLWLIDYEYSGNNEASFELGNIWSEASLAEELLPTLVDAYWDSHSIAKLARARMWALMSKYGWTLWAVIQQEVSPISFDYWSWGMEKYERAIDEFNDPRFEHWLAQITQME